MKITVCGGIIVLAVALLAPQIVQAQGFVNLDFEHPILPLSPIFDTVPTANAIPGWAAYYAGPAGYIGYDNVSLGGAGVFLEDTNATSYSPVGISLLPIQGNYSVLLEASAYLSDPLPASIGQTGTVPVTAESLTFFGNLAANIQGQTLQVTFNGQPLSFMAISNTLNYKIYSADISAFA